MTLKLKKTDNKPETDEFDQTRKLSDAITFNDLFRIKDIQRLQDEFSQATGVASIITSPDGIPITKPSNFSHLCSNIIRKTKKGLANCYKSDAVIGQLNPEGPIVKKCMSSGLWDAGAGISVEGRHIANWLIGQVRDETQAEAEMLRYAREIGADEEDFMKAFFEVPAMSESMFNNIASMLFTLANQISAVAYQNVIQSRLIAKLRSTEEDLLRKEKSLSETEHRLAVVVDNLPSAMIYQVEYTPAGKRLFNYLSENVTILHEVTIAAVLADANILYSQIHPDDVPLLLKAEEEATAEMRCFRSEARFILPSGTVRWFELTSRPRKLPNGNLAWDGIEIDITERKLAEEALQESELKFRNLFENVQETFYEVNIDGVILNVSPSVLNLSKGQYTPEDLIGKPLFDLYADYSAREAFLEVLQAQGIVTDYEIRLRNRDGTTVDCSVSSKMQCDTAGRPIKIIGSLVDNTRRKQAEMALLESEARFKALHNASFGGISIHDKGIILDCNQGLSDMTGYSMVELIGMNGLLLIAEESKNYVMDKIISGYERPYEAIGLRKNGEKFPMRLEARNIPHKGKTVRIVEFRDITEQRKIELNREKIQAELTQALKMESVGRLAGGVAHDFNNMLGVILGYSELALEKVGEDHPLYFALHGIQMAARRSADLTRQLLAFARKQTVAPAVLDLNNTVGSMLNMLQRLIGEDIDLAWLPGKNLGQVKVDPSQIDQILANLAINARDAITDTGKVTIETGNVVIDESYRSGHLDAGPGEYVMLAVSDNGAGMSDETLSHLFEPFFTTKEMGKGTGLGLATVYGIVKQNNGFINVYSEPGQGTTFKIYLSRYTAQSNLAPESDVADRTVHGFETILLVEDEPMILEMSTMMVEKQGYTVLPARTPGEAVRLATEYPGEIHLLMTDVVMPEMNGRDLAKNLSLILPNLKRLFMSGYTANVIAHHGVLDEGVNFIQKPFTMTDLVTKIREVLDKDSE